MGALTGEYLPPADKSISHRAALFAAMCPEPVRITGYLNAADTNSTLAAVEQLGAVVERRSSELVIRGVGLREPRELPKPIDVGNAGTLMRLITGWLAGQEGREWTLDGDSSIRKRPIDRVSIPLAQMGASIEAQDGRYPPFKISGRRLRGFEYTLPVASAQVKSAVLIAGLVASGETTVIEPEPSRDHTERMLLAAGVHLDRSDQRTTVTSLDELELETLHVPRDLSSAAFMIAAALIVPGSQIEVKSVGVNWTRTGFLRILERMGANIEGDLEPSGAELSGNEPVSDLKISYGELTGTVVKAHEVPLAIDELPLIALLGCFADGETVVRGAEELKVKESDRIASVVDGITALGGEIEATDDGFVVSGSGGLRGGNIEARGDHRIAMLGAIAGLASSEGVTVEGMDAAAISYPGFETDLRALLNAQTI